MSRLSVAFIVAVSAIALTQVALAADMPLKAPIAKAPIAAPRYDWSGFYVGGHVGYLWGRTRVEEDGVVTEPGAPTDGIIGGVLAGYNWQNGPVVFGLEGDFGWTHAHGVGAVAVTTQAPNTYDLNWTSHLRGRAGYAVDNWLFYVAGGLAVADLDFHEGNAASITGGKYFGWSIGRVSLTGQTVRGALAWKFAPTGMMP
jgi:outer membrane immunogenic protein